MSHPVHSSPSGPSALEELIEQEKMPADLAQSIVTQFDNVSEPADPFLGIPTQLPDNPLLSTHLNMSLFMLCSRTHECHTCPLICMLAVHAGRLAQPRDREGPHQSQPQALSLLRQREIIKMALGLLRYLDFKLFVCAMCLDKKMVVSLLNSLYMHRIMHGSGRPCQ
jgi:hypothetical protein